jgi:uncharacterized membrane protein
VISFERSGLAPGPHQVEVTLATTDALPFTNRRFATFEVQSGRRVLTLADNPDEAVVWKLALETSGTFRCDVFSTAKARTLGPDDLAPYHAVCLLNVAEPDKDLWQKLELYVRGGRGLVIIPGGEELARAAYNDEGTARQLLPGRLEKVVAGHAELGTPWRWTDAVYRHAALAPFREWNTNTNIDFGKLPRGAFRYWEVQPYQGGDVLITYDDKERRPALLERRFDRTKVRGRVLLFTTTLDGRTGWNNYLESVTSFYLVLANKVMTYVAGDAEELNFNYLSGQTVSVALPPAARAPIYSLQGPGLDSGEAIVPRGENQGELRITQAVVPGNYTLGRTDGKQAACFSLNVPPEECQLGRVPPDQIEALLGAGAVLPVGHSSSLRDALQGHWGQPVELLPWLMILVLVVLAVEGLLASRFYREAESGERRAESQTDRLSGSPHSALRPPLLMLTLTTDPAWPWSVPRVGLPALLLVAAALIGITVWTYLGQRGASSRRVLTLLGLRLAALVLACLAVLRPSLAARESLHVPSTLFVVADGSESMTIQDEFDSQSRWDYLRRLLGECAPQLQQLRDEHNVNVVLYRFAGDVGDFDAQGRADGKRTDVGQLLQTLLERHGHERYLRGLLLLSDGADNGTRFPALPLAGKWRSLPCPVHTFAFGKPTTAVNVRDLAFTAINPEPSPVAIKGKLTVKGTLDAPGFENARVRLHLFLDGKEMIAKDETLPKSAGNEVQLTCDAPPKPGEVMVTLKVEPLPGEAIQLNNEISTHVTVTKEGLSVLYVEGKYRAWEPKFIRHALSQDPRIRLYEAVRLKDEAVPVGEADLFQLDKQHYDVIILGDISARRLSAGNPGLLTQIRQLVAEKGVGLMMLGGYETFANSDWQGTPLETLLPVHLDVTGQVEEPVQMVPAAESLRHYVLRLADSPGENKALWDKLPKLNGMTRLGRKKDGATVLAQSEKGALVLAGHQFGEGRTLAFAGDTTHRWWRPEFQAAGFRFWKQVVLWLAKQEEAEGNVWVKPDARRLAAGGKLAFGVGLRGKGGVEIKDARFEVTVVGPQQAESAVPTAREQDGERGTFWKTDVAGEYRLVVRGKGRDSDGQEASGEATARFLVYQDEAEMARQAADHDFLTKLAHAGGGEFHRAEELATFLERLQTMPLAHSRPKAKLWPDWRRTPASKAPRDQLAALAGSGILACFVLFVLLLCLEWFLRRRWGLV